jgi:hypothetical protein
LIAHYSSPFYGLTAALRRYSVDICVYSRDSIHALPNAFS